MIDIMRRHGLYLSVALLATSVALGIAGYQLQSLTLASAAFGLAVIGTFWSIGSVLDAELAFRAAQRRIEHEFDCALDDARELVLTGQDAIMVFDEDRGAWRPTTAGDDPEATARYDVSAALRSELRDEITRPAWPVEYAGRHRLAGA